MFCRMPLWKNLPPDLEADCKGPPQASIPAIQWIILHTYGRQNRIWHLVTFKLLFLKAILVVFWMFHMNLAVDFLALSQSSLLSRVNLKSECSSILLPISLSLQRKVLGAETVLFVPILTLMQYHCYILCSRKHQGLWLRSSLFPLNIWHRWHTLAVLGLSLGTSACSKTQSSHITT